MTLQFYQFPSSQGSRAIQALLIINKIPYESIFIDLMHGDQNQPEFLKINPSAEVPAIKEGAFTLAECHTILRYICNSKKVEEHWYPTDPQQIAKVDWYLDWHHSVIRPITWWVKDLLAAREGKESPFDREKEEKKFRPALERIENELLETNLYLVSKDEPTIADLSAHSEISQLAPMGYDLSKFPRIREWLDRMFKYDGVQEAYKPFQEVAKEPKNDKNHEGNKKDK